MRLLHQLHRAEQAGTDLFAKKINGHGSEITLRQAILLDAIKSNPGASQTILTRATGVDRSTLSDIIKRMVAKGWVERARTPKDDRAYAVELTAEGKRMLATAAKAAQKAEADLMQQYPSIRGLAA